MRHLLLPLAAILLISADTPAVEAPSAFAIHVNVHPSMMDINQLLRRPTPDTYTCSVTVFDADSKKPIAGMPSVVVLPGREETATGGGGDYRIKFTVKIKTAANADTADTHVTVTRNEAVVAEQRSMITLMRGKPGNVPLN